MNEPAAVYARFSPRRNPEECESIVTQLDRLHSYCVMAELEPAHVLEEPETSAGTPLADREQGARLLDLLRREKIKHIVAQRVDRLFRDAADGLTLVRTWLKKGIALHLADQGGNSINIATATGWYFFATLATQAEFERLLIGERTKGAMLFHQANGRRMTSAESVRIGTGVDPEDAKRTIANPREAAAVARMLELHAAGATPTEICRTLEAEGFEPRGKEWHRSTVKRILARA